MPLRRAELPYNSVVENPIAEQMRALSDTLQQHGVQTFVVYPHHVGEGEQRREIVRDVLEHALHADRIAEPSADANAQPPDLIASELTCRHESQPNPHAHHGVPPNEEPRRYVSLWCTNSERKLLAILALLHQAQHVAVTSPARDVQPLLLADPPHERE